MQMNIEEGYAIACQAVGEGVIREKVLNEMVVQLKATVSELKVKLQVAKEAGFVIEEAEEIVEGADAISSNRQGRLQQNDESSGEASA